MNLEQGDRLYDEVRSQLVAFLRERCDSAPHVSARISILAEDVDYVERKDGFVFISYSKQSPEPTKRLALALKQGGYNVWWDTELISGDIYNALIKEKLDTARAVVVIWTKKSVQSTFVLSEASRALRSNKLVSTCSAEVNLEDLPLPFDQIHQTNVDDLEEIVRAIERH